MKDNYRFISIDAIPSDCSVFLSAPARLRKRLSKRIQSVAGAGVHFVQTESDSTFLSGTIAPSELNGRMAPGDLILVVDGTMWFQKAAQFKKMGLPNVFVLMQKGGLTSSKVVMVVDELRLIFIPVFKSAYSSITLFLARQSGLDGGLENAKSHLRRRIDLSDPAYRDYFKFAFVRNPWDRVVSCFEDKFNRPSSHRNTVNFHDPVAELLGVSKVGFDDFVKFISEHPDSLANQHWVSQYSSLYGDGDQLLVDFTGKLENMGEDFGHLCKRLELGGDLQHSNRSPREFRDYRKYYSDATAEVVLQRYREDVERFGYFF